MYTKFRTPSILPLNQRPAPGISGASVSDPPEIGARETGL
jgi:hypothetical protein